MVMNDGLQALATQINEWRKTKTRKNQQMPKALWDLAASASKSFPIDVIAKECALNGINLHKFINQEKNRNAIKSNSFVDVTKHVMPPFAKGTTETKKENEGKEQLKCVLRMSTQSGLKISIGVLNAIFFTFAGDLGANSY